LFDFLVGEFFQMRILFTKLRHIGDNLLVTPIMVATKRKYPDAEIWLAVRRSTEGILAGCPEIDRIVTTARPEESKRSWKDKVGDLATLSLIARTRFDYAFELGDNDRGRTLVAASIAPVRGAHRGEPGLNAFWQRAFTDIVPTDRSSMHQVEMDYIIPKRVLGLPEEPPALRFDTSATRPWGALFDPESEEFAVLHAATRWESKSWPLDRWRATLARILEFTPRVIVSCGPGTAERKEAEALCSGFGDRVATTGGKSSWGQLAWLLQRARYYVGVDTAAMHLAAAMQCPSVTLFGQSIPGQFGPWRCPHVMVAPAGRKVGEPSEKPGGVPNYRMLSIGVDDVVSACVRASAMKSGLLHS
jgi:heptosyltransferase-3